MAARGPLLDDEVGRFLRSPVAAWLAAADHLGVADCARIAGLAAVDGRRLRVLIAAESRAARANAVVGARAAVLVTHLTSYRSLQWKGHVVAAGQDRTPGDPALLHAHVEAFWGVSAAVGTNPDLVRRTFPTEVVPIVIEVDALYDQTPGPGAGRALACGR